MTTSIAVGNRRLMKLADFLEKLPRKAFNYSRWGSDDATELSCGTSGCALGWAASMPEFRRLGLRLAVQDGDVWPVCGKDAGEFAGCNIFALDEEDAQYLFIPMEESEFRATPKQVAKKIRAFVKARA